MVVGKMHPAEEVNAGCERFEEEFVGVKGANLDESDFVLDS